MTAAEDNKQADPTASSPQETPKSKRSEVKAPAEPPAAPRQEETASTAREANIDEQPTPPRVPAAPHKTRPLPERKAPEPQASATTPPAQPAPTQSLAEPSEPAATLADIDWMPPAEDQVARFLNDVADIAPPPVREREGARAPGFIVPAAISPEEAKRKKAKAEPFWSQVVATPMERPALPSHPTRPRRATRKRARTGKGWLMLISGILILLVLGLAILLYTHPGLLHLK